jgi:hypothetical protein
VATTDAPTDINDLREAHERRTAGTATDDDLVLIHRTRLSVPSQAELREQGELALAQDAVEAYKRRIAKYQTARGVAPEATFDPNAPIDIRLGAKPLSQLDPPPIPPLLLGIIHSTGHTIVFGPGGSRKGTFACQLIIDWLATYTDAGPVMLIDAEHNLAEWKWRLHSLGIGDNMNRVIYVPLGDTDAWHGAPPPIWNQADDLAQIANEKQPSLSLVDSIQEAVGVDMSSGNTEVPARYSQTIKRLRCPTISLAHTPRNERDPLYPFGSQQWHTGARATWFTKNLGPTTSLLVCRKHNTGRMGAKRVIEVEYGDGEAGLPLSLGYTTTYAESTADRITGYLDEAKDPKTSKDITEALNFIAGEEGVQVDEKTVQRALERGARATARTSIRFTKDDSDRWTIAKDPA